MEKRVAAFPGVECPGTGTTPEAIQSSNIWILEGSMVVTLGFNAKMVLANFECNLND